MPASLENAEPLLILAVILLVGIAFGLAAKRLRLPSVTGQIVAGVMIGGAGFDLFGHRAADGLAPITEFALGLMAVSVGAHLNFRRLRNAFKRLLWLLLFETVFVVAAVAGSLAAFESIDFSIALIFGTIAISTAPATIVAIVRETRAKGVFVKTLVAAVALNNMACIFGFELSRRLATTTLQYGTPRVSEVFLGAGTQLLEAALTGGLGALAMFSVAKAVRRPELLTTTGLIAILLTVGVAQHFGYSALLSCLFLGLFQANVTRDREHIVDRLFRDFEPSILAVFFTLAGMELSLEHARSAGLLAVSFFVARAVAKYAAGYVSMRLAGATSRVRQNMGLALIPQAGVAVGLVVLINGDATLHQLAPAATDLFAPIVLTAVVANEVVGPILTRIALTRSGEAGHDRGRVLDFIHEENIKIDLEAESPQDAIEQLVDLLIKSHHLDPKLHDPILESVLAREAQDSTCVGGGVAIPHGVLPEGVDPVGVIGISARGLNFHTPDDRPVHCVVLLLSNPDEPERHLQLLAMIAGSIGSDPAIQAQLFNARTPAHAYEVLHHEDAAEFNLFLDELG
jgi:Kef-type K+ transport system membrane component KefB/mannitol/fructose-specific phosphotransferase system IIA component (Ntr-type)